MKRDFDVVVVGGGMVGAACAALLGAYEPTSSLRVAMLEPRPAPFPPAGEPLDLRVSALSRASQRLCERSRAIRQERSETLPLCNFFGQNHYGFRIAPGKVQPVRILFRYQAVFIALHCHGDRRTRRYGVHAIPVTDVVRLDHGFKIVVAQQIA